MNVQSTTDDETRMIVAATNDRTQGTRYLYDRKADRLTKLGDIDAVAAGSQDGGDEAHLLHDARRAHRPRLPDAAQWRRAEEPAGDRAIRTAARGRATAGASIRKCSSSRAAAMRVLQVNFRGSTGYGRKFWEASFKQWGLQDAGRHHRRRATGWSSRASPTRSASASTAAATAATRRSPGSRTTPDLYACGVDYVGVSNLFTFMKTIPPYWKPYPRDDPRDGGRSRTRTRRCSRRRRRRCMPTRSRRRC